MTAPTFPFYFPVLKWHSPEQGALQALTGAQKRRILPIIELGDRPYDGDQLAYIGTWEAHFESFATGLAQRWGSEGEVAIDQGLVDFDELANKDIWGRLFKTLYKKGVKAVPVLSSTASWQEIESLRGANPQRSSRWVMRVQMYDFLSDRQSPMPWITETLAMLDCPAENVDLILDYQCVDRPNPDSTLEDVVTLLDTVQQSRRWRNVVLLCGAFPASISHLSQGLHRLPRTDWLLFREALEALHSRTHLCFGDYGPAHWDSYDYEPRAVRQPIRLVLTEESHWCIIKGRTPKGHGYDQYRALCATAAELNRGHPPSSYGQRKMFQRASGAPRMIGVGIPAQWRRDSFNQHMVSVIDQIERELVKPDVTGDAAAAITAEDAATFERKVLSRGLKAVPPLSRPPVTHSGAGATRDKALQ